VTACPQFDCAPSPCLVFLPPSRPSNLTSNGIPTSSSLGGTLSLSGGGTFTLVGASATVSGTTTLAPFTALVTTSVAAAGVVRSGGAGVSVTVRGGTLAGAVSLQHADAVLWLSGAVLVSGSVTGGLGTVRIGTCTVSNNAFGGNTLSTFAFALRLHTHVSRF
jgi:hypothetical protein